MKVDPIHVKPVDVHVKPVDVHVKPIDVNVEVKVEPIYVTVPVPAPKPTHDCKPEEPGEDCEKDKPWAPEPSWTPEVCSGAECEYYNL